MIKDPKQIVTPYAFNVHPDVLGLPLASPKRRLAAVLLDLLIASILTALGNLILATAVTALFFWIAIRSRGTNPFRNFIRFGAASFASFFVFAFAIGILEGTDVSSDAVEVNIADEPADVNWTEFGRQMATIDYSDPDAIEESFEDLMGEYIEEDSESTQPFLSNISVGFISNLTSFSSAIEANDSSAVDSIRNVLAPVIAEKELDNLQTKNRALSAQKEDLKDENAELEEELENPGIYRTLKRMFGMMGLSLGWIGLYFVASISFFRGQTLGKRFLKIRVVRLNNKPISLFFSFERFGGYAAGIATGLLGFFQIMWDANRQGIHDKIAGTVVIDLRESKNKATASLREEILDMENLIS